jgi:hypothetical protein
MTWRAVNEFMVTTMTHYQAWLAAKYTRDGVQNTHKPQNTQNVKPQTPRQEPPRQAPAPVTAAPQSNQSQSGAAQNGAAAMVASHYQNEEYF